jgi:hypothetical protein
MSERAQLWFLLVFGLTGLINPRFPFAIAASVGAIFLVFHAFQ